MASIKYWLWLTSRMGSDTTAALHVLNHFVTPERAFFADPEEYDTLPLPPKQRSLLHNKELATAQAILERCQGLGLRIMTVQDADYPERLRQIANPPVVLYIKGRVFHFDEEVAIGVVGSREASDYGIQCAARFGFELAQGGALLVSGMAEGVDSTAIKGALRGGGPVVSVLAGGVDVPFPPEHRYLYADVAAAGALISEYPPGTPHRGAHFLRRNRILSALTLGVLAVECRTQGGTMSTMNWAMEQDRDIFAIPGAIDAPMSQGPNWLIQQGGKLVTSARDILVEYWSRFPLKLAPSIPAASPAGRARLEDLEQETKEDAPVQEEPSQPEAAKAAPDHPAAPQAARAHIPLAGQKERFTDDELVVLAALEEGEASADTLIEATGIPARRILSALTILQVQGVVQETQGRRFITLVYLEKS